MKTTNRTHKVYVMFTDEEFELIKANSMPEDKSLSGSVRRMLGFDKLVVSSEIPEILEALEDCQDTKHVLSRLDTKVNFHKLIDKYGFKTVRECLEKHSGMQIQSVRNFLNQYKP